MMKLYGKVHGGFSGAYICNMPFRKDRCYIIAEAGVNHNGDMEIARALIKTAAEAGADAVKFQLFHADKLVSPDAPKAAYQKSTTRDDESHYEMLKKLELSLRDVELLIKWCHDENIQFLASPFDIESIELLNSLGVPYFKVPSGEITNYPYLKKIAFYDRPVILSTGMSTLCEIEHAMDILLEGGLTRDEIILLHCNTEYPTPFSDVNLRAMLTLRQAFGTRVGYSDHTTGIAIPIAAVALGACVIEKHFTIDKSLPGPDHKASLEPDELKAMVEAIRNVEAGLGDGFKRPSDSEKKNIPVARKSIVAAREIKKGEVFTEENLTTKRPATGISPMRWQEVIGKKANRDYKPDEPISL